MKTRLCTVLLLAAVLVASLPATADDNSPLCFRPDGTNGFRFDTGLLRGQLRAGGSSRGLSGVVHVPSGMRLDRSMGLFGHYRVFSTNHRYGTAAWDWPSEAQLQADGSVAMRWPASPERPFELRAVYRWAAANQLDLVTSVEAKTDLSRFESFLASYFAPEFTNALVYVGELPDKPGTKGLLAAESSQGIWQAFPREAAVVPILQDGRWKFEPNPVDWTIRPTLAYPLGVRRCPANGLSAVLMSPSGDCFAVSTPHQTEAHYSMYLSLFGRDLKAGETAQARVRLLIGSGMTEAELLKAYRDFSAHGR
ncbi:MAG TPA: hypothetical protein VNZ22_23010 [Bacillota bacterium]|nr:hypothetical protein [Bacillota bacterium]